MLVLSVASTALSLYSADSVARLLRRRAHRRDTTTLVRVVLAFAAVSVASFITNVVSGSLHASVSADILFDMRLEMYRHLQRLSPRFYARTRLGDVMSRINNDIGEIQRIASETALAWLGNVLSLGGTVAMLAWLDARLFLVAVAAMPFGIWALVRYRGRLEAEVAAVRQRSADIGSFLIETLQAMRLVVASNAQAREVARFRARNDSFVGALMSMQRLTYLSGGLPGVILSLSGAVFVLAGCASSVARSPSAPSSPSCAADAGDAAAAALMGMQRTSPPSACRCAGCPGSRRDRSRCRDASGAMRRPQVTSPSLPSSRRHGRPSSRDAAVLEPCGRSRCVRATKLAIVGPSGSGKSTIADLLLRLIGIRRRARAGRGTCARLAVADLRRSVALVEQEPCLLRNHRREHPLRASRGV